MNNFRKIITTSKKKIETQGIKHFFKSAAEKIKRNEFYIKEATSLDLKKDSEMVQVENNSDPYKIWISKNELTEKELKERYKTMKLDYRPLISILVPVFNPPAKILKEAIQSVRNQIYENWELCITNGSTDSSIREILDDMAKSDSRIIVMHTTNMGISENTNLANSNSKGEFIALLDHDDSLSPNALLEIARALDANPKIDFIYSDSDKITEEGERFEPFFKPDWSPELMLSSNYAAHLCVIRKKLVDAVGGFKSEMDGAQDWDLILRVTEKSNNVLHIPKVLYHWRIMRNSTAIDMTTKPYALNAQIVAVTNFLHRKGVNSYITHGPSLYLRCKIYQDKPRVSIIIPVIDDLKNAEICINSLRNNTEYPNFELILVGNVDTEQHLHEIEKRYDNIKIISSSKYNNIPTALNAGSSFASSELLVFFDSRLRAIEKGWLAEMSGWFHIDNIGCVGSKLINTNGVIQHAGIIIGHDGEPHYVFNGIKENSRFWCPFGAQDWYRNYNAVSGKCMMIKKKIFEEIGGFQSLNTNYDIDLCLRIRERGYRILFTPYSRLCYDESMETRSKINPNQHGARVDMNDCYYSPNLSTDSVTTLRL